MIVSMNVSHFVKICQVLTILHQLICRGVTNFGTRCSVASHTHTHKTILLLFWNLSGTTRVSRYQKSKTRKVKTSLDLLEQEIVSGSSIQFNSWIYLPSVL